jgi:hypothetical protein
MASTVKLTCDAAALASAQSAADDTIANGGGTFRIGAESRRLIAASPTSGYAVGIHDGTFRTVALDSPWTRDDIAAALLAARDYAIANGADHVGTWVADGVVHVDPVAIIADYGPAVTIAHVTHQLAIWDFARGREIATGAR